MGLMNFFGLHNESKFEKYFKKAFDSFSPPILADIICNELKSRNSDITGTSTFFEFIEFITKFAYNLAKQDMPYINERMIVIEIKTYEYIQKILKSNYHKMGKYIHFDNKSSCISDLFFRLHIESIETWIRFN